jgi:hypothetical protein
MENESRIEEPPVPDSEYLLRRLRQETTAALESESTKAACLHVDLANRYLSKLIKPPQKADIQISDSDPELLEASRSAAP